MASDVPSRQSIPIERRIARYQAWRNREAVARPLMGLLWEPDIPPLPEMLEQVGEGAVRPDQIRPDLFLPYIEKWYQQDAQLMCEVIQPFTPAFGIPWVEAIAGCPVVARPGSLWAEPFLDDYHQRPRFSFDSENPWLCKLIEFTQVMVELADGRFAVALPQMRGPLDCLAAMRDPHRMCLDFSDCAHDVNQVLSELTDLWIGIAEAVLQVIPPFHAGFCSRMKMWAPGPTVTPQNDISTLISPRMYETFVLPRDQKIIDHFPYHSFHMHSTEYHQIDNILKLEELTAIQLTLEHTVGGPPLEVTLPAAERVLRKKPLLLTALDIETAEICLESLPSEGLCVMVATNEPNIAAELASWLESRLL